MPFLGNIIARIGADTRPFSRGLSQAQRNLLAFQRSANSSLNLAKTAMIGASVAIGAAFAAMGVSSVKTAMSVEASTQQIKRILGNNSQDFLKWADTQAAAYNMSKADAIKYGATYGNLLMTVTNDQKQLTDYTQQLLKASAVVASATGREMEDTMERIRSGILGNTESIEDLGINVNIAMIESTKAFQKFANGKSWQQLSFQTQQQIRLFAILEQAQLKYGTEVSQNTASSLARLTAILKDISLSIGQAFLPILDIAIPVLSAFAENIKYVTAVFSQFMQALFGTGKAQSQTANNAIGAAKAQTALGNATKKAGDKAKGGLAGFDEINQLQEKMAEDAENTAEAMGASASTIPEGGAGDAVGGLLSSDTLSSIQNFRNNFINAWTEIRDFLSSNKEIIISAISGIGAAVVALGVIMAGPAIVSAFETLYIVGLYAAGAISAAIAAIGWPVIATVAAIGALAAAFTYLYQTNEPFRNLVSSVWQGIKDFFSGLWNNVMVPFGQFMLNVFVRAWELLSRAALWLYTNALVPLGNFLMAFWKNIIEPLAKALGEYLAIAFSGLARVVETFWKNVIVPLGQYFMELFNPAVEAMAAIFVFLWEYGLSPLANNIASVLTPAFSVLGSTISWLWQNVLAPLVTFLVNVFVVAFDSTFQNIHRLIDNLKETFKNLLYFITNVFKGNWGQAWEDIKGVFKGIMDTLADVFKAPIRNIISILNTFIDKVNSIKINIPAVSIPGIGSFGGGVVGFNISNIPRLYNGGITNGPTLATVGDNIGGREAIVPLSSGSAVSEIANALMGAMQFNNQGSNNTPVEVVFKLEGNSFARAIIPFINSENSRTGTPMIIQTT